MKMGDDLCKQLSKQLVKIVSISITSTKEKRKKKTLLLLKSFRYYSIVTSHTVVLGTVNNTCERVLMLLSGMHLEGWCLKNYSNELVRDTSPFVLACNNPFYTVSSSISKCLAYTRN